LRHTLRLPTGLPTGLPAPDPPTMTQTNEHCPTIPRALRYAAIVSLATATHLFCFNAGYCAGFLEAIVRDQFRAEIPLPIDLFASPILVNLHICGNRVQGFCLSS
jgi:hypothetical protein